MKRLSMLLAVAHGCAGAAEPAVVALQGLWSGETTRDWNTTFIISDHRISTRGCPTARFVVDLDRETNERFRYGKNLQPSVVREIVIKLDTSKGAKECGPVSPVMVFSLDPRGRGGRIAHFQSDLEMASGQHFGIAWHREDIFALQGIWEGGSRADWHHRFTIKGNRISSPGCSPMTFRVVRDEEGPERFWARKPPPAVREIGVEIFPARAAEKCNAVGAEFMLFSLPLGDTGGGTIAKFNSGLFEDTPYNIQGIGAWGRKALPP